MDTSETLFVHDVVSLSKLLSLLLLRWWSMTCAKMRGSMLGSDGRVVQQINGTFTWELSCDFLSSCSLETCWFSHTNMASCHK